MRLNPEVIAEASARVGSKLTEWGVKAAKMPTAAPISEAVKEYIAETRLHDDVNAFERAIGTNDLLSLSYLWSGLHASRSVGRIMIAATESERTGAATGFLIAPGLAMTNWHVFETPESARRARIQFGYEADETGRERISTWFSFNPDRFFVTDRRLDYCVVFVDAETQEGPEPLPSFGWLRLNPKLGKTAYGQYLSLIQHPEAQVKQIAIRENELLPFDEAKDDFLTYRSDTFKGSSGSPVFNDFWEVVALHHAGKPDRDEAGHYRDQNGNPITDHAPTEDEVHWVANEGARTSRIIEDLRKRVPEGELRTLLESTFSGELPAQPTWQAVSRFSRKEADMPDIPPGKLSLPRGSFVAYLPLNVSIRVESLDHPPRPTAGADAPGVTRPEPQAIEDVLPDFEKLNFDDDYEDRRGYDEHFLGRRNGVPMPAIDKNAEGLIAPLKEGGTQLDYHHFSVLVHKTRRMPVLAAVNVDYQTGSRGTKGRSAYGKDQWILDDRMETTYQIPAGFYDRWKKLDYGHLVRREDNCWGASAKEMEYGNSDTFHLTNCTPQHEEYNRANLTGIWGRLETAIGNQSKKDKGISRLCIFAGPVFDDKKDLLCDDKAGKIRVPLAFWKVVVAPLRKGGLGAYGFILSQADVLKETPPFEDFVPPADLGALCRQVTLVEIEAKTIVRFDKSLKNADVMAGRGAGNETLTIQTVEELVMERRSAPAPAGVPSA